MLIYFDTCSLQRPLDNKTHMRVRLEAEAMIGLLAAVEDGKVKMVGSAILDFETAQNPNRIRKTFAVEMLRNASKFVALDEQVIRRARTFLSAGVKPIDALHLARAEAAEADYFCTCDDILLEKGKLLQNYSPKIRTPIELSGELQ
jgi:predicted nucleic acid-binding protein